MEFQRPFIGALAALVFLARVWDVSPANAQQPDFVGQSASPVARMSLEIEDGRITASIRNYPFGALLRELGSRTGVTLVPSPDMEIESALASAEMADVPLDEGLRRLLENYDTFFYYGVVGNGSSSLRAVWIYPKGAAVALRPVPPEVWAGTKELQASLADADPQVRARAYEALMSRPDHESRTLVLDALRAAIEPDAVVRHRILSSSFSAGMPLPHDLLMFLVRWDASEQVRLAALDALAFGPALKEAAEVALTDSSQVVRQRAKKILAEFEPR